MPSKARPDVLSGTDIVIGKRVGVQERRRIETRNNIVSAARALFEAQGYEKTTTQQIAEVAGIVNGSLFHLFPNKEEILKAVIVQMYDESLKETMRLLKSDTSLINILGFPAAMSLYLAYNNESTTEMLYRAHISWAAINGLIDSTLEMMEKKFSGFETPDQKEAFRLNMITFLGFESSLISEKFHGRPRGFHLALRADLKLISMLFDLDLTSEEIDTVERRLSNMLDRGMVRGGLFEFNRNSAKKG